MNSKLYQEYIVSCFQNSVDILEWQDGSKLTMHDLFLIHIFKEDWEIVEEQSKPEKIKIDVCKAKGTTSYTLMINDNRAAGLKSGYGYETLQTFFVDKKALLKIIK